MPLRIAVSALESALTSMCMLPLPRSKARRPASRIESNTSINPTATATVMMVVTVENIRAVMLRRMMVKSVNISDNQNLKIKNRSIPDLTIPQLRHAGPDDRREEGPDHPQLHLVITLAATHALPSDSIHPAKRGVRIAPPLPDRDLHTVTLHCAQRRCAE